MHGQLSKDDATDIERRLGLCKKPPAPPLLKTKVGWLPAVKQTEQRKGVEKDRC